LFLDLKYGGKYGAGPISISHFNAQYNDKGDAICLLETF